MFSISRQPSERFFTIIYLGRIGRRSEKFELRVTKQEPRNFRIVITRPQSLQNSLIETVELAYVSSSASKLVHDLRNEFLVANEIGLKTLANLGERIEFTLLYKVINELDRS